MQPVIEVQCPFCNARGQIMTPPIGAIIAGQCPLCAELVLLFDGVALPLDEDIILRGSSDDKKAHIIATIMDLIVERVGQLVDSAQEQEEGDGGIAVADGEELKVGGTPVRINGADIHQPDRCMLPSRSVDHPQGPITPADVADFVKIDLRMIDEKAHFEKIFGPPDDNKHE